jgi:DhnA family fructose-bisphosphate aldolase class Ia
VLDGHADDDGSGTDGSRGRLVTDARFDALRSTRAERPAAVLEAAGARRRRPFLDESRRLLLVAADHPARAALSVRADPLAMADRYGLLDRLLVALSRPGVDGVLATADIVEDLLILGALEDKVVVGSMNRGGLQGASFELDDRFTAYDAETIEAMGLDGGKMLCRIALGDPGSLATLESCGKAVTELARRRRVAMIEPFMSVSTDGRTTNQLTAEAVIASVAVAAGLGAVSAYTWLKLPVVDQMDRVMAATTLPTVLLGGDPTERPDETYAAWERALCLPGVHGLVVGRALLYPPDGDVAAAVDIAASLVRPTTERAPTAP